MNHAVQVDPNSQIYYENNTECSCEIYKKITKRKHLRKSMCDICSEKVFTHNLSKSELNTRK